MDVLAKAKEMWAARKKIKIHPSPEDLPSLHNATPVEDTVGVLHGNRSSSELTIGTGYANGA